MGWNIVLKLNIYYLQQSLQTSSFKAFWNNRQFVNCENVKLLFCESFMNSSLKQTHPKFSVDLWKRFFFYLSLAFGHFPLKHQQVKNRNRKHMLLEDTSCCVQGSKFKHWRMGLNKWSHTVCWSADFVAFGWTLCVKAKLVHYIVWREGHQVNTISPVVSPQM